MSVISEFKEFAVKGNVVDMAVGEEHFFERGPFGGECPFDAVEVTTGINCGSKSCALADQHRTVLLEGSDRNDQQFQGHEQGSVA